MKTALAVLISTISVLQSYQPAFAAAGDYVVTDAYNGALRFVDHITGAVSNLPSSINAYYGVVIDSNGNYITTDPFGGSLHSVNHINGAVSTIATGLSSAASAIATDLNGDWIVTDHNEQELFFVNHLNGAVTPISTPGIGSSLGVAVDSNGNYIESGQKINDCGPNTEYFLAIVDHTNGGVTPVVYSNQGNNPICYFSSDIGVPAGVAIDSGGNYIITDRSAGRLFSVTPIGAVTFIAGGLGSPQGVAIDSNGNYIVTDSAGHRLLSVTPAGAVTTIASTGLFQPFGIAIEHAIPTDTSSSAFRITAISRQTNDIRITWQTIVGSTNELQATSGDVVGGYSTNSFSAVSSITNVFGTTTNYLDVGGATNAPSRYYRVRLVP